MTRGLGTEQRQIGASGETSLGTGHVPAPLARWIWALATGAILIVLAEALRVSYAWPLVHDAPLIHYVLFLMAHGMAPYRDIIEINLPGTYVLDWLEMHILGGGALGLWLWDTLAGLAGLLASAWIVGKNRRLVGIVGGALAYLIHERDGAKNLGQRDWISASLLLVALGCLFEAKRRRQPAWMAGFMGLCALTASIKPPMIAIGLFFLGAICLLEWRDNPLNWAKRSAEMVGWSLAGCLAPVAMVVIFLAHWGVTREFLAMVLGLDPWYASLAQKPLLVMIVHARLLLLLLASAGIPFVMNRSWRRWESDFLALAALLCSALFLMQRKGWSYQLSEAIAFASLWAMFELHLALKSTGRRSVPARITALVMIPVLAIALPILLLRVQSRQLYSMTTLNHLEGDLTRLGGKQLSGKVQCLDMTAGGCINVLYRMQLVQSTGFIYDFYLFPKTSNAVTRPLQQTFMAQLQTRRPEVIVLSSHIWPGDELGYGEIANLPAFQKLLQGSYKLDTVFHASPGEAGYRIYVLNSPNSPNANVPASNHAADIPRAAM